MTTTLTSSQTAALVDLSLDTLRYYEQATSWPKPQNCNTIWNTSIGNWPTTPAISVSPLGKPLHD